MLYLQVYRRQEEAIRAMPIIIKRIKACVSQGRVFFQLGNLQEGNSRTSNGRHSPNTPLSLQVSKTASTHLTKYQLAPLSQAHRSTHLSTTLSSSRFSSSANHLLPLQHPHPRPSPHHQHPRAHEQPKAESFHPPSSPLTNTHRAHRGHTAVQESPLLSRVQSANADYQAERRSCSYAVLSVLPITQKASVRDVGPWAQRKWKYTQG